MIGSMIEGPAPSGLESDPDLVNLVNQP